MLSQQGGDADESATPVFMAMPLEPRWVSEGEAENFPIVSADDNGLKDRAAGLAGEDAVTAGVLLLNHEFRGFQTLLVYLGEEVNPEGDDDKARYLEDHAREWVEQKIIECVQGLRQLENGSTWLGSHYDDALSPVALTAAFMADRYHTLREVKRAVGNLKQKPQNSGASGASNADS